MKKLGLLLKILQGRSFGRNVDALVIDESISVRPETEEKLDLAGK